MSINGFVSKCILLRLMMSRCTRRDLQEREIDLRVMCCVASIDTYARQKEAPQYDAMRPSTDKVAEQASANHRAAREYFCKHKPLSITQQGIETVAAVPRGLLCLNPHDHDFARTHFQVYLPSLSLSNQRRSAGRGTRACHFSPKMELIVSGSPDRVKFVLHYSMRTGNFLCFSLKGLWCPLESFRLFSIHISSFINLSKCLSSPNTSLKMCLPHVLL